MQNTDLQKQWEYDNLDSLDEWKNNQNIFNPITYQDEIDKANDSKDQTKDSMQITVKQEFLWEE